VEFQIRAVHLSDLPALYRICLETVDAGSSKPAAFSDPELVGHYYAGPYAVLEPDLTFVLTGDGSPCGYILGTRDSFLFAERCETDWFPVLRERYTQPDESDSSGDANMIRRIHRGHIWNPELSDYPAHLHIDLLPHAQGQGWGRQLMQSFISRLTSLNVPGVHLGVGIDNRRAIAFYEKMGFKRLQEFDWGILFGMHLGK